MASLKLVSMICFRKGTLLIFSCWLSSSGDNLCILRYSWGRQFHEFCQKSIYILIQLITLYTETAERDWKLIFAVFLTELCFALKCKTSEGSHWYETMPLHWVRTIMRTVYGFYWVNPCFLKVKNLSFYCNSWKR